MILLNFHNSPQGVKNERVKLKEKEIYDQMIVFPLNSSMEMETLTYSRSSLTLPKGSGKKGQNDHISQKQAGNNTGGLMEA